MIDHSLLYASDERGEPHPFRVEQSGPLLRLTLPRAEFAGCQALRLLPALSRADAGSAGYYILPRSISFRGDLMTRFLRRENQHFSYAAPIMALYGIKKPDLCCLVRFARSYPFAMDVRVQDGVYECCATVDFRQEDPYDDIRMEILVLDEDADYAAMAAAERALRLERGEITPLAEKCTRATVEYARRYPLIRIRMGWKPSPSPIAHQTPENEPDMHVACTFARVRDFADALRQAGVEGAELQLVGWNIRGHDGRFPQLLPPDPALGGMEELRRTIGYVQSLGYRISLHTNLIDSYEIADCFSWDDVCVRRDGSYLQVGHYGGGDAYHVCPLCQLRHAREGDQARLRALGCDGLHFIDVISIVVPDVCFSPAHPCSTAEGISTVSQIMQEARAQFGGFSSEGCMDFAIPTLDYGLYVSFGDGFGHRELPLCDSELPFWELIYHGVLLYNPTSPTVNYPIKSANDRLTFLLRGGRPTFYLYSKFRTGGQANWMGEDDLTIDSEEQLHQTARTIAEASARYLENGLDALQLHSMTDYLLPGDGVEAACYDNGVCIAGNFAKEARVFRGVTLAPGEWTLLR